MKIIYKPFAVLLFLLLCSSRFATAQSSDPKTFEKKVQEVFNRVSSSCVRVSKYDSTGHRRFGSFSGVIVTADGYILTAAHATITAESYLIELPDGKKYRGTGLGRIPVVDAALIKIDTLTGKLPQVQMGWSYDLKVNQPCLSISYPASLSQVNKPVLRLGSIIKTYTLEGKMQTTCLMEPGDSGGPVFDLFGRVIALHSKIESGLDVNLENPIDNYRKYWAALKVKKDYPADYYPDLEPVGIDPIEKQVRGLAAFTGNQQILSDFRKINPHACTRINSSIGEFAMTSFATIVVLENNNTKYVVSKSSLVGDHPVIMYQDSKAIKATVIKRDVLNDLVLMKADGLDHAVMLKKLQTGVLKGMEGSFLISPSYTDTARIGVLGYDALKVPVYVPPMLGIECVEENGKVKIIGFTSSTTQKYGMHVDDFIVSFNKVPISSVKQLNAEMSKMKPGDDAKYEILRSGKIVKVHALLQRMPKVMNKHLADDFEGGASLRSEGFDNVFVHDTRVRPEECGGPVFDLQGDFLGINISRVSRTSTLGIPANIVTAFVLSATTEAQLGARLHN